MCPFLNRRLKPDLSDSAMTWLRRSGVTPRSGAHSCGLSSVCPGCGPLFTSQFSEDFKNESRNDFDYRFGGVLVWWRRLVLGARAPLTRAVPEKNCRSGVGHGILDSSTAAPSAIDSEARPVLVHRMATEVALLNRLDSTIRRKHMNPSTKDEIKGSFHEVKGKVKEKAGHVTNNPKLEAEGKVEHTAGKIEKKVGQIEKVLGK